MRTLLSLTVANIKSLARDRAAVFWSFAFPIMFVLLFGAIFGGVGGSSKITVGFVNEDVVNGVATPYSAGIQSAFAGVELLNLKTGTLETEKAAMQRGDVSAVIVIPKGTAAAVDAGTPIALEIYVDPSNTQTTQVVQNVATQVANGFNLALAHGSAILTVEQRTLQQSEGLSAVGYLVPSILAMALMQLGVFAAIPLVQQREKGILKRLGATPLARWQLVGSNVLERLVVAVVDAVLILGIGLMVFNVKILGSLFVVAFLVLLGAAMFLALGYAIASFLKTTEQAEGVVQVVQIPMMFLSGIFFSFEFLPGVLQTIARFLPLTYLGDALRQVMVNGPQIVPLGMDIAILFAWLIGSLAISARFFRWE